VKGEHHTIESEGGRFLVELDTDTCLQLLSDSGAALPALPAGKNTVWAHFRTIEGRRAAVIVQAWIEETETDFGREVNGASVIVCLDDQGPDSLDRFVDYLLKAGG
jgi:hypothetical protein